MNQKFQYLPFMYLKEESEWIINHIHYIYSPCIKLIIKCHLKLFILLWIGFYIIWSLGFDQVHIFDIPLLQIWNSYLNYS